MMSDVSTLLFNDESDEFERDGDDGDDGDDGEPSPLPIAA